MDWYLQSGRKQIDKHTRRRFEKLGDLWKKQRYDLYHTPFETLSVVPDPYWHVRRNKDELAQRKAIRWARTDEWRPGPNEFGQYFVKEANRLRSSRVSMVPYSMLMNDIEKYALGRRFFVTSKGYFGLAPKEAEAGDKIAILFGSNVPFVLRQSQRPGSRTLGGKTSSWKIIGDTYVQDIMCGEVMEEISAGNLLTSTLYII